MVPEARDSVAPDGVAGKLRMPGPGAFAFQYWYSFFAPVQGGRLTGFP